MTTETQTSTETQVTQTETVVIDPREEQARADGWVSKDEWVAQGKNPDDWRSAREYIERGELFEEIRRVKDESKHLNKAFKALIEHHQKVRDIAIKEAIAQLKAEKKEALENHDIERVFAIDERLEKVKEETPPVPVIEMPVDATPTATFQKWHRQNRWYEMEGDDEASRYADMIGAQYRASHKDASEAEILAAVESKVAKRFPEKFENPMSTKVSEVNPRGVAPKTNDEVFKLTPEEEEAFTMFKSMGAPITREKYVEDIKKIRGKK